MGKEEIIIYRGRFIVLMSEGEFMGIEITYYEIVDVWRRKMVIGNYRGRKSICIEIIKEELNRVMGAR